MADERIIELDTINEVPADGYLAIDTVTGDTYKILPIKIGAQYTIQDGDHSFTLVGSNGYSHTVNIPYDSVSMTQAEYDALTPAQKADGTARFITDADSDVESELWSKVGRQTLDTDSQVLSNAVNELKGDIDTNTDDINTNTEAISQLNSSLTNSTTYSTDTTERVLIGYKQGKPLYRQYLTYSNLTVPVNTEQILTSASIPSGAGNISISDKSYIETGTTRMNACCANSNVYSVGTSIRWRQTYSSGSSWNLYIWVEYTLPN